MTAATDPDNAAKAAGLLVRTLAEIGLRSGHRLHRVILNPDGGGEAEYSVINPVEVLVFKWRAPKGLLRLAETGLAAGEGTDQENSLVCRKKCVKCLVYDRPA